MTIITGYKATDKDIKCRGYQFTPGEWHECDGELEPCGNGFHFCKQPSGPWSYYNAPGTRIWNVEAEGVLALPEEPGADYKLVARRIRLVAEVVIGGDYNTGDYNTGDYNTGHRNTGDYNTGDYNTGHRNTGDYNTGDYNTGHYNTGDCNTGDYNTGDYNTGDCNTGDYNTGDYNTGDGNATNYSSGFFCQSEPTVISFDTDTGMSRQRFFAAHGKVVGALADALTQDEPIEFGRFASLPGITPENLASLHQKFIDARKKR